MKKTISSLGKILNKKEQKNVNGGINKIPLPFPCGEFPPLAPPPPGCTWTLKKCNYVLVCLEDNSDPVM